MTRKLVRDIDARLYELGWTRSHPRISNFVEEVQKRHSLLNTNLETLPTKYLLRLYEFLKIYSQCDQVLRKLNLGWESPIVGELAGDYGGVKKMSMLGWRHLYECLENQYFLIDMPKPSDGEPKKAKKKKSLAAK
jgi:hypothetical protein